jgi:hypothetical protein
MFLNALMQDRNKFLTDNFWKLRLLQPIAIVGKLSLSYQ